MFSESTVGRSHVAREGGVTLRPYLKGVPAMQPSAFKQRYGGKERKPVL